MVRIAAATISALPLGTIASTLRMKWARHRCQLRRGTRHHRRRTMEPIPPSRLRLSGRCAHRR
jgi:hypothetical protein